MSKERPLTRDELIDKCIAWQAQDPSRITLFIGRTQHITLQEVPEKIGIRVPTSWREETVNNLGEEILKEHQRTGIKRPNYNRVYGKT